MLIVVTALALFALGGLFGVIWLIHAKAEAGSIAIVSGLVGTALGSLSSMLVSTSKSPAPPTATATTTADGQTTATAGEAAPAPTPPVEATAAPAEPQTTPL